MRIPIVSRKEGANTKKGRKAFFRAYFLPDSDRSVRGGSLRRCSGAIVAVLILGRFSQKVKISQPGSPPRWPVADQIQNFQSELRSIYSQKSASTVPITPLQLAVLSVQTSQPTLKVHFEQPDGNCRPAFSRLKSARSLRRRLRRLTRLGNF